MACDLDRDECRQRHIAPQLPSVEPDGADFKGRCPVCGHGGFRISHPITKMRNIWVCHCQICNGGKGCSPRDIRAAMLRVKIHPWCLGSYIGKDKPKHDLDQLLKIAQTVDDLINYRPNFSAADMLMALAEARGDKIPTDHKGCAEFAKGLGMSNGNAYNIAKKWAPGSSSRPAGSEVPPHPGGSSEGLQSYHTEEEPSQTPSSEARNLPKVGNDDSRSWKEPTLDEPEVFPTFGKRTLDDNGNRRPAA